MADASRAGEGDDDGAAICGTTCAAALAAARRAAVGAVAGAPAPAIGMSEAADKAGVMLEVREHAGSEGALPLSLLEATLGGRPHAERELLLLEAAGLAFAGRSRLVTSPLGARLSALSDSSVPPSMMVSSPTAVRS